MDFYQIFSGIEATGIATWVRESLYGLPIVNALHVISIALVFGTIFVVDLRLVGWQSVTRPFTNVAGDLLKWTWLGFAVALVTGLLMFSANATTFYVNTQFQLKLAAIALAGINMMVFELVTVRSVSQWDTDRTTPNAARFAGFASITLWVSVIVLGRWIGYSKGFNFDAPMDIDFDLDNLFGAAGQFIAPYVG